MRPHLSALTRELNHVPTRAASRTSRRTVTDKLSSRRQKTGSQRSAAVLASLALLLSTYVSVGQESSISMGNGDKNWILTDGASRTGSTFVFPEVNIDGNGWLVMHPFTNGKPNGKVVAGYAALNDGVSRDISISVDPQPAPGDLFIVMLHRDANANGEFDFVFVSENEVVDIAVFEGTTMVGHVYKTP